MQMLLLSHLSALSGAFPLALTAAPCLPCSFKLSQFCNGNAWTDTFINNSPGSSPERAVDSCDAMFEAKGEAIDGQYWINVAGKPVLSFCAMHLKDESSAIPTINFGTGRVRENVGKAASLALRAVYSLYLLLCK